MELLAPAGGIEQMFAAIRFGADAVYLACESFGMRARANNFKLETLGKAVDLAHKSGVSVHVACNILMHEADMHALPEFFVAVQESGADALIISDLGAFTLAKKYAPNVELHVSTQASVANAVAARAWYDAGATRIVCAREMSLDEIATMRANTPADLAIEVFAHGAMCMAVSGRCLISSYLTGRSANAGACTQPCRWAYTLEEEKRLGVHFPIEEDAGYTYIMNAMDLNMLEHLDELKEAGVDSIKIEGRNKKAFYVASVVGAYRRVLDGESADVVKSELFDISHRPYCTGFFFGEPAQASDYDGYEQECLHVADVIACEREGEHESKSSLERTCENLDLSASPAIYKITTICRNRWERDQAIEALVPRKPAFEVTVRDLCWLPDYQNASQHANVGATNCDQTFSHDIKITQSAVKADVANRTQPSSTDVQISKNEVKVDIANRAMEIYTFKSDREIPAGSYLRLRKFHRTARHGG